jgi:hypothetical protein
VPVLHLGALESKFGMSTAPLLCVLAPFCNGFCPFVPNNKKLASHTRRGHLIPFLPAQPEIGVSQAQL